MHKHFDIGSLVVIILTLFLFAAALVTKGFTHDLFLEVGVFLVSVKLIVMAYKNSVANKKIQEGLNDIRQYLGKKSD
jgi:Na+-translocating ferredoxin:NAD+ oxidoreductase RnfE subunit